MDRANSLSARGTAAAGSLPAACQTAHGSLAPTALGAHSTLCGGDGLCQCVTARHFCPCLHMPPCQ